MDASKDIDKLSVSSRGEWRKWLAKNHRIEKEIWIIYNKNNLRQVSIPWKDFLAFTVEEAICYGWIDSRVKRFDESTLGWRFTPRRSPDNWSKYNRARALRLLREGKMTAAGIAVLPSDLRERLRKT